ncbi:hypothetical protein OSTOST_13340, partial [Ostertagia ostertagi]
GYARCLCGKSSSEMDDFLAEKTEAGRTTRAFSLDDEELVYGEDDYYPESTTGTSVMEECKSERTKLDEPTGYEDPLYLRVRP